MSERRERKGAGSWTDLGRRGWRYRFAVDGKRRSVTARTQEQCRKDAAKIIEDARRQVPSTSDDPLRSFLERWLDGLEDRVRPRTVIGYRSCCNTIILPSLGDVAIGSLTHRDVERMMAATVRRGLTPRSANLARAVLRSALTDAQRERLVTVNAAALAHPVPAKRPDIRPPTPAQMTAFLVAMQTNRRWPIYLIAVSLGLRQGELLGLRWQDVQGEELHVGHTLRYHDGLYTLDPPKTAASVAVLPVLPAVAAALDRQRDIEASDRLLAGKRWQKGFDDWGLVFRSKYGRPVYGNELTHDFQRDLTAAHLPRARFHDLRHATATYLLAQGVDMKVIQAVLRHSSIAVTAGSYAHVDLAMMREALRHLDTLGGDAGPVG